MAIEIVDFPINSMGIFHGKMLVHQRVPGTRLNFNEFYGKWPWYISSIWNMSGCTSSSYSVAGELFEYYYSLLNSTAAKIDR